eukprot:TRINITY_DN2618_c2_g1_i1.p1 TRINITY_DN2618_c2_g1~~TRINITY_DN2618_c2_g1_i1.p1  ORF type:complete len:834 (-),score=319.33 TRINITY_DN2618_c2_g1_i1:30-2531(-)
MFSLRQIDADNWPWIRGIRTLDTILQSDAVDRLVIIPGHIAILSMERKILKILDTAPVGTARRKVDAKPFAQYDGPTIDSTNFLDEDGNFLYRSRVPISQIIFDKEGTLVRLFIIEEDGQVFIWEWDLLDWMWKYSSRANLWKGIPRRVKVKEAHLSSKHSTMMWFDEDGFFIVPLKKVTKKENRSLFLYEIRDIAERLPYDPTMHQSILTSHDGIWFIEQDRIQFWSYRSNFFHTMEIDKNSQAPSVQVEDQVERSPKKVIVGKIVVSLVHSLTHQLIVVDQHARVFSITTDAELKLSAHMLCSLTPPPSDSIISGKPAWFLHHQYLGYLGIDGLCMWDIKCGIRVDFKEMPEIPAVQVVETNLNAPPCFSYGKSLWELRGTSVVKQMQALTNHPSPVMLKNSKPHATCAASLASDWDLSHWEAKFILDFMLNERDEEIKRNSAEILLPHLQSPALILPLISNTKSGNFINSKLKDFVENYYQSGKSPENSRDLSEFTESKRISARNSFHYHTPLNTLLYPHLEKYLELNNQGNSKKKKNSQAPISTRPNLSEISDLEIFKLNQADMELMSRAYPSEFLKRLESSLGIVSLTPEVALSKSLGIEISHKEEKVPNMFSQDSQSSHGNLFELMCRLYFQLRPRDLIPFLELVESTFPAKISGNSGNLVGNLAGNSWKDRALFALPQLFKNVQVENGQLQVESEEIQVERISVKMELLSKMGQIYSQVEILLHLGRWEDAINILELRSQSSQSDQIHVEIFHVMLRHAFKNGNFRKLKEFWKFRPEKMNVFHMTSFLREFLPEDGDPKIILADGDESACTIGMMRSYILDLIKTK